MIKEESSSTEIDLILMMFIPNSAYHGIMAIFLEGECETVWVVKSDIYGFKPRKQLVLFSRTILSTKILQLLCLQNFFSWHHEK